MVVAASFCLPSAGTKIVFLAIMDNKFRISVCKEALTSIKDEYIINDSLLAVALSAAENDQVLSELRGRVAVPRRRRLASRLTWINL